MRLDLGAARWSMDAHGVPLGRQLVVWELVSMLHDARWHRERTLGRYCQAHQMDLDADEAFDLSCRRCLAGLGLLGLVS